MTLLQEFPVQVSTCRLSFAQLVWFMLLLTPLLLIDLSFTALLNQLFFCLLIWFGFLHAWLDHLSHFIIILLRIQLLLRFLIFCLLLNNPLLLLDLILVFKKVSQILKISKNLLIFQLLRGEHVSLLYF